MKTYRKVRNEACVSLGRSAAHYNRGGMGKRGGEEEETED